MHGISRQEKEAGRVEPGEGRRETGKVMTDGTGGVGGVGCKDEVWMASSPVNLAPFAPKFGKK